MDISKVGDKSKISETQVSSTQSAKTRAVQTDKAGTQKAVDSLRDGSTSSDKVRWSEDADVAAEGIAEAKAAPAARSAKVAELKAAIRNGTYKIDNDKIAEKMIQHSLEEDLITRKA